MTVTYQLSDKRGDAILLVKAEGEDVQAVETAFAAAAGLAGLGTSYETFGAAGPATVPTVQTLIHPQAPQQEPWGQPPVPQFQPQYPQATYQQPQVPAAAAPPPVQQPAVGAPPVCQHGVKQYKSGEGAKGPWAFWGCTARSDDPTKCDKQWVR